MIDNCDLLIKVNYPSHNELNNLKEKSILLGVFNPSQNKERFKDVLKKY